MLALDSKNYDYWRQETTPNVRYCWQYLILLSIWFNTTLIRISIRHLSVQTVDINVNQTVGHLTDLSDILQHGHASHLLLDGSVVVDLVPKLGSVGSMIHLMRRGKGRSLSHLCS